jgi:hypothetical protein
MLLKSLKDHTRHLITWGGGWLGPLPTPEKWVFIVGCYNSGTSLLHALLASHPQIGSMAREGQHCTDQLLRPKSVGLARLWALEPERFLLDETSQAPINVQRIKRQWGLWLNDPTRPVLIEKTPANAARVRWLQDHFDNAHFIGIVRNGYAVAEGIRRKAGHSLEKGALQWQRSNELRLADFDYLRCSLLLSYEELIEQPETTLAKIFSFLALPHEQQGDLAREVWNIHGEISELRNMNDPSLAVLAEAEMATIEETAGAMLRRLGYLRLA